MVCHPLQQSLLGFQFWLPDMPRRCKNALCCIVDIGIYFSKATVRCVGQVELLQELSEESMTREEDYFLPFPFSRVDADFVIYVKHGSTCISVYPL
ncbi:hypothetical protein AVEN_253418-1 [Araneus ventricosus]|uniref:Uncharacterized protein n=1 Tax=Araneus ventricosus TaxID=182803 RepID=A0A4Y2KNN9_ARAVE|nr:hypothetical protein AVEN_253418-1 [Araneus ventricosus]